MGANGDLLARRMDAVPRGVATAAPMFAVQAENATIWDAEGRQLHRFRQRHRRARHGPSPSARAGGGARDNARPLHAHLASR